MTSTFNWDSFQPLTKPQPAQPMQQAAAEPTQEFDWNSFEELPKYDTAAANQEQEGMMSSFFRNVLQVPKGLANLTAPGAILNALGALGTGEALAGLDDEFSEENIARLRQMFPGAPWENFDAKYPTYEDFRADYLKGVEGASRAFPTVENISRGIESLTGLPLESKTLSHELIQLGTGGLSGLTKALSTQPSKFSGIFNKIKSRGISEKSVGPALQKGLAKEFSQGEIIAEGRRLGMTDAEIAPLLNSERRVRFLSRLAHKGKRSGEALSKTYDKLSGAYETLKTSEAAAKPFAKPLQTDTLSKLQNTLQELPAVVREGILTDTKDLLKQPNLTGRNLINYRQKIEGTIRSNPEKYKQLSPLKKVVDEAILKSDPTLAREYNGINRLYGKYAQINKALKPDIADKFVNKGEAVAALYGALTFNIPLLAKIGGEHAARRLITETFINPRFQQLSSKLVSALNENKLGLAAKIAESMSKEVREVSPEIADEMEEIDWDNF